MVISTLDIVVYVIGAIIILAYLFFYFKGLKNAQIFEALEEKDFPFKEVYFVGYAILETINYQYKSSRDRKQRKELTVLYGEKYAEYYMRVTYSQKLTIAFTVLTLAVPMYGLANSFITMIVMLVFAGTAYYYFDTLISKRILARSDEMLSEFSDVVSKLALLTNSGMIMREAWELVSENGDTELYKEMKKSVEEMHNGTSEADALYRFGNRCIIPEIKKFTSTIIQGMEKGNSELSAMLQGQSAEVWRIKRQLVKRQGEQAASKLLFPMLLMFLGILVIVIIPVFANLGV